VTDVALAGRRIDAGGAPARFPSVRIPAVREGIRSLLLARRAEVLVRSAVCGSDPLVLEGPAVLEIRGRVVLRFADRKLA
jgi:hypothetical protein